MNTNKKVLIPIIVIQMILIVLTYYIINLSLIGNLIIISFISIGGAKIYKSFCDYEGKLRNTVINK